MMLQSSTQMLDIKVILYCIQCYALYWTDNNNNK